MKFLLLFWLASIVTGAVLQPSEDDFYIPPANFANQTEGSVLKYRKTPGKLRSLLLPMNVNSWQIMVRSKDKLNNPTYIVSTIIQPHNFNPENIVFFQMAQDTANGDCAPSYALQYGASMSTLYNQLETVPLQLVLSKGWTIVAPDYQGPYSYWPGGKQTGYATLDSIRGVLQTNGFTGLSEDAKVICWGYSGGTIPTSWTSALIDEYPDIQDNLIGAVLGGYIANFTATAFANEGSLYAGLVASAIAGLIKQYPKLDEFVREELSPQRYQELLYASDNCLIPVIRKFKWHKFFSGTGDKLWSKSGFEILRNKVFLDIVEELTLGATKDSTLPKVPLFMYHGKNDDILPWEATQKTYENWCEWGVESIEFFTDSISGHITGLLYSAPAVVKWMSDRFDGVEPVKGCKSLNKFTFLKYPNTTKEVFHYGLASVKSFAGFKVGPTDVLEEIYQIPSSIFASTKSFIFSFSTPTIVYNRIQNYIGKITVQ